MESKMSEKKKFGFVVLHYCTLDMTKKCIAAIQEKMAQADYEIVVVDNASGNGTGKDLAECYKDTEHVSVLLSKENLGFAKGNNLGYVYAREDLHCDFICVMNNDVILLQDNFAQLVEAAYEAHQFAVMGPHIELKDGRENAMYYEIASIEGLKKERHVYEVRLKHITSSIYLLWNLWDRAKLLLRIFLGKIHIMPELKKHEDCTEGSLEYQDELVLHGCCLIFSPIYLTKYKDAFVPDTFMFREEELLYLRCKEAGIPMVYCPEVRILHLEDISTDYIYKTERKKEIFNLENQIKSLGILLEHLEVMQK